MSVRIFGECQEIPWKVWKEAEFKVERRCSQGPFAAAGLFLGSGVY